MNAVDRLLRSAVSKFIGSASDEEIRAAVKRLAKLARDPDTDILEKT